MFGKMKVPSSGIEYIIVGLGNPGKKYEMTRHNVGFKIIDYVSDKCGVKVNRLKFKSLCADTMVNGKHVLLMKPQTFMNNSGQAVVEAMLFYKVTSQNVIILFDDISLVLGKLRIRKRGSDGGHNGVKSIIYLSGEDTFPRVKIGIGSKPNSDWNLDDWVISRFNEEERVIVNRAIEKSYDALKLIVDGKIDIAMSDFNFS